MPASPALTRLSSGHYNTGDWNATTNQGGMGGDGHRQALVPPKPPQTGSYPVLTSDIAAVAAEVAEAADLAVAAAASTLGGASVQATSAAAMVLTMAARSVLFSSGKDILPGMPLRLVNSASPLVAMDGVVTAYDRTTGALGFQPSALFGTVGASYTGWVAMLIGSPVQAASHYTTVVRDIPNMANNVGVVIETPGVGADGAAGRTVTLWETGASTQTYTYADAYSADAGRYETPLSPGLGSLVIGKGLYAGVTLTPPESGWLSTLAALRITRLTASRAIVTWSQSGAIWGRIVDWSVPSSPSWGTATSIIPAVDGGYTLESIFLTQRISDTRVGLIYSGTSGATRIYMARGVDVSGMTIGTADGSTTFDAHSTNDTNIYWPAVREAQPWRQCVVQDTRVVLVGTRTQGYGPDWRAVSINFQGAGATPVVGSVTRLNTQSSDSFYVADYGIDAIAANIAVAWFAWRPESGSVTRDAFLHCAIVKDGGIGTPMQIATVSRSGSSPNSYININTAGYAGGGGCYLQWQHYTNGDATQPLLYRHCFITEGGGAPVIGPISTTPTQISGRWAMVHPDYGVDTGGNLARWDAASSTLNIFNAGSPGTAPFNAVSPAGGIGTSSGGNFFREWLFEVPTATLSGVNWTVAHVGQSIRTASGWGRIAAVAGGVASFAQVQGSILGQTLAAANWTLAALHFTGSSFQGGPLPAIVTTTDAGQVDAGAWASLNSLTFTVSGNVYPCFSFDGRRTWVIWSGGARVIATNRATIHGGPDGAWYSRDAANGWVAAASMHAALLAAFALTGHQVAASVYAARSAADWTAMGFVPAFGLRVNIGACLANGATILDHVSIVHSSFATRRPCPPDDVQVYLDDPASVHVWRRQNGTKNTRIIITYLRSLA